jgi:alpha-L-fucosidase 2
MIAVNHMAVSLVEAGKQPNLSRDFTMKKMGALLLLFSLLANVQFSRAQDNLVYPEDRVVALKNTSKGQPNVLVAKNESGSENEQIDNLIDGDLATKAYTKLQDTGFVLTLGIGKSVVKGLRFATGGDMPERDPLTVTIEGSNDDNAHAGGARDFTLIYSGPCGLKLDPGRRKWGEAVKFDNSTAYKSYRVLVTQPRKAGFGAQLSEVQLLGKAENPQAAHIKFAVPASQRNRINAKWVDRAEFNANGEAVKRPEGDGKLWYRGPAGIWEAGLPLGNGHLGAMLFGGVADERVQLNVDTLWDGYPLDAANSDSLLALPEVRKLLFEGKIKEAEALAAKSMMGKPRGVKPYQSLGELFMETPQLQGVSDYIRVLDLDTATAFIRYSSKGVTYQREAFSSAPANVIVLRFSASKKGAIDLKLILKREKDAVCSANPQDQRSIILQGQIDRRDENGTPRGTKFAAQVTALAEGGKVGNDNGILTVDGTDAVTVLISGASGHPGLAGIKALLEKDISGKSYAPGGDPAAECAAIISKAEKIPYDTLKAEHIRDYRRLADRVSLSFGPLNKEAEQLPTDERIQRLHNGGDSDLGLEALYFRFGRYLLISSSRPGRFPANLQGIWAWQMHPPWNADFHTNINVQMNYWPAQTMNLSECELPLFDLMDELTVPGHQVAKVQYGANGWVVHHLSDPWGFAAPADGLQGIWPVGSAWLAAHPWEHYQFTQDKEFLAKRGWPLMKSAARFILDFLVEAPADSPVAGKLVTNPSYSPENEYFLPDGKVGMFTYGATMDLMIIHELLNNCIAASKILNTDAEFRKECASALSRLAPVRINDSGRIMEWIEDYKETDIHHRHVSHLYGLYPGNMITTATPDLLAAARKSLALRGDAATGWSLGWKINLWARLRDGDHAHLLLNNLLKTMTLPNLLDVCPPFQIDGNFGATAACAEMLLQSQLQDANGEFELQLLPALPKAWQEGKAIGLRARGGITVDLEWADNALTKATLTAQQDIKIKVSLGQQLKELSLKKDRPLTMAGNLTVNPKE